MNQCLPDAGSFTLWVMGMKHCIALIFSAFIGVYRRLNCRFFWMIARRYSPLIPAACTTFAHFVYSC